MRRRSGKGRTRGDLLRAIGDAPEKAGSTGKESVRFGSTCAATYCLCVDSRSQSAKDSDRLGLAAGWIMRVAVGLVHQENPYGVQGSVMLDFSREAVCVVSGMRRRRQAPPLPPFGGSAPAVTGRRPGCATPWAGDWRRRRARRSSRQTLAPARSKAARRCAPSAGRRRGPDAAAGSRCNSAR
jgi:hypothetical protein